MIHNYLPPDPTPEELKILDSSYVFLYKKLKDPRDKFIVAFHMHLGFGKEDTARALNVSYPTLWKRLKKIQELLKFKVS